MLLLAPEEIERRFWDEENARTELYERSRRQQQLEFALAAASWTKSEDVRIQEFQRSLVGAMEALAEAMSAGLGTLEKAMRLE